VQTCIVMQLESF